MVDTTGLPVVDESDPYAAQYEIARRKLQKAKEEALKITGETCGARGRFYGGILPQQEAKVEESYGQQLSDVAQNIAIERAAEEKASQRVKEAQTYQTSERTASQAWSSAEANLGRQFTTEERNAVQAFQSLSQDKQQNWQSAEAALGRTFSTEERQAIQAYQTGERQATQTYQTEEALKNRTWQSAEASLGRAFTTEERKAVEDFTSLQTKQQLSWQSAEAVMGRLFTTEERKAVQTYQQAQYDTQNALAKQQQDWLQSDEYWNKEIAKVQAAKASPEGAVKVGVNLGAANIGGALSGAASGMAQGAAIGSVIPVVGTVIGGVVGAVGGFISGLFSDERLKDNVVPTKYTLDDLMKIEIVDFDYKPETGIIPISKHTGVIAQDLEKHYPYAVGEYSGYKTVNYQLLIPLLIKSIQELNQKIEILEKGEK